MSEPDQYVLGYRQAEQRRLQQQAQQLAHESTWLFDQTGMARGARVVEMGCGPHGCLELLSERVGPSGSVVGIERSADAVALARKLVVERGLGNVEVLEGDARSTGLPRASFDVVTARLVLVNVPQPEQIVAEAVALVRSGGWVAFHEADYVSHICDPPSDAWTSLIELLETYSEKNGIDPFIGRKLPRLLRAAGLGACLSNANTLLVGRLRRPNSQCFARRAQRDAPTRSPCRHYSDGLLVEVRVNPVVHVYPPGHGRRSILLDFAENLSERILAQNLVGERELASLKSVLQRHLDDPATLVVSHLFFQAWGRKPM